MFYAMRAAMGQEKNVASLLAQSVKHEDLGIKAILSPEEMQGYIFVESEQALDMRHPALKVPNLRGLVEGDMAFEEHKKISRDHIFFNSCTVFNGILCSNWGKAFWEQVNTSWR